MNYYEQEIQHVLDNVGSNENIRIKIQSENAETKWLNLNQESLDALNNVVNSDDIDKNDNSKLTSYITEYHNRTNSKLSTPEHLDYVACSNCEFEGGVEVGAEQCPICQEEGCLQWGDEHNSEITAEELKKREEIVNVLSKYTIIDIANAEAQKWLGYDFTAHEVEQWMTARCFNPRAANQLRDAGIEPEEANYVRESPCCNHSDTIGFLLSEGDINIDEANELLEEMGHSPS